MFLCFLFILVFFNKEIFFFILKNIYMKLSSLEGIFSYILLRDMFNLQVHHEHTHSRFRKRSRHAGGLKNGKKKLFNLNFPLEKRVARNILSSNQIKHINSHLYKLDLVMQLLFLDYMKRGKTDLHSSEQAQMEGAKTSSCLLNDRRLDH
jgi:hypothetical protein